jgi:surfactin synthase thioesterase subunit
VSNKAKPSKFSRRYETFLSEASNEEIVSISKELAEEMNAQIKSTTVTALTLLGISMGALILSISLVTDLAASIASSIKNMIFLMRMISIAFMCITALIAFLVIQKVNKASSF